MKSIAKRLKDYSISNKLYIEDRQTKLERKAMESDFYTFVQSAWSSVEPSQFIPGWHLKTICEHLEECYFGNITYMVVNLPPRMGKSLLFDVLFPAWALARAPSLRFFYISYGESLSKKFSVSTRRLIASPWYQKYWGNKVRITKDVDNVHRFETTAHGSRFISTIGGMATGAGGNFVICDDPNNAIDVTSLVIREKINLWWSEYISTRSDSPKGIFCRIVVQQRLHEEDLSGHILSRGYDDLVHLNLPMEFEIGRRCVTVPLKSTFGKNWKDPRKKEGELLWPEGIDAKRVRMLKMELGSYAAAGQLQQRPSPKDGMLFQKEWFQIYDYERLPELEGIYQSWDTAISGKETSAYSACTTWGLFKNEFNVGCIILLDVFQAHMIFPELMRMVKRMSEHIFDTKYDAPTPRGPSADCVIIESKATGDPLHDTLAELGIPTVGFNPGVVGNKHKRAEYASAYVEVGRVYLRAFPNGKLHPASEMLLKTALLFPNDKSNDIIDSMSQLILKLKADEWLVHSEVVPYEEPERDPDRNPFNY